MKLWITNYSEEILFTHTQKRDLYCTSFHIHIKKSNRWSASLLNKEDHNKGLKYGRKLDDLDSVDSFWNKQQNWKMNHRTNMVLSILTIISKIQLINPYPRNPCFTTEQLHFILSLFSTGKDCAGNHRYSKIIRWWRSI